VLEPSESLVRTCIATADHLGDIVRLLAIQLSEHRIDLDAGHERVRSLYRRHRFEELPRRRLVRRLAGPDGA
jgi:hypothetical protein